MFLTGITGAALARSEGIRVFFQVQRELGAGRLPGRALLDALCVLVGGAFLLTPGVLTDVLGFGLLFPLSRRWIQSRLRRRFERAIESGAVRVDVMGGWPGAGPPGAAPPGSAPPEPAHPGSGEVGRAEIRTPTSDP